MILALVATDDLDTLFFLLLEVPELDDDMRLLCFLLVPPSFVYRWFLSRFVNSTVCVTWSSSSPSFEVSSSSSWWVKWNLSLPYTTIINRNLYVSNDRRNWNPAIDYDCLLPIADWRPMLLLLLRYDYIIIINTDIWLLLLLLIILDEKW